MKVRCRKLLNIYGEERQESRSLTIGKDYVVLEISCSPKGEIYIRIISDDEYTPALFDITQFDVISNKLPSNWVVVQNEYGEILFRPESWSRFGFWEDFFDRELPEVIEAFRKEVEIMYHEEHEPLPVK